MQFLALDNLNWMPNEIGCHVFPIVGFIFFNNTSYKVDITFRIYSKLFSIFLPTILTFNVQILNFPDDFILSLMIMTIPPSV